MKRLFGLTALTLLLAAPLHATDDQYEWTGVDRIVAVGDIHGAYDNFVKVLQNAKLIDEKERWIGGSTHLVQNGDVVDRGPDSRKVMDLLMKLEDEAEDAGGRIHLLIGNHEAMDVVGILDLVSPGEYEAFVDRNSRKRRDQIFDRYYEQIRREAKGRGEDAPKQKEAREAFDRDYPLGFVEHRQAFGSGGKYGKWIMEHNTAIKINGVLFSHGDWSEKFSTMDIGEINDHIRKELRGESPIQEGLSFDEASPLQYRGLAETELTRAAQEAAMPLVDRILQNLNGKRMVVGHTVTGGTIESRFGGKHISIDTGMLELYRGGHRVALEIVDDELRAIHDGGTVPIPEWMDETALSGYWDAVAAVDPTNVDVQLKRVDAMQTDGRLDETVPVLETLFESKPAYIPFRYRDWLGERYRARGDTVAADVQFRAYIDALSGMVEASPSNVNVANLLARYCIDKGLELDLAEQVITKTIERAPENYGFRLTMARVRIAKGEYSKALEALAATAPPADAFTYDTNYLHGLAYAGLDEPDKARSAFQRAIDADPDREEAQAALDRLDAHP